MNIRLRLLVLCLVLPCLLLPSCKKRKTADSGQGEGFQEIESIESAIDTADDDSSPQAEENPAAAHVIPQSSNLPASENAAEVTANVTNRGVENPEYNDGNGTILSYVESDWVRKIIRKCEMDVTIGEMLSQEGHIVYESMEKESPVSTLNDGDSVSLLQQCTLEYLQEEKDEYGRENGDLWYKLRLADGSDGWICTNDGYLFDSTPYYGNSYEVMGTISYGGKKWTAHKLSQQLSAWENLSIRDKPGTGASVLYTIRPGSSDPVQTNVELTAITEEEDTIDGETDHWVKVNYKGFEGWVFGAYLSAERGGPKYYLPEDCIAFELGGTL
ncbi:MAG: SH3 domain-containing protein [Treponema sp.]|nr:SH3 domain-containing protein [Treponema sp.]